MFIRVKTIADKKYGYLVENTWKDGKAKQKVKKYLGRIIEPEPLPRIPFEEWKDVRLDAYIDNTKYRDIVRDILRHEIEMHSLPDRVRVTKNGSVKRGKQDLVLALNEGHLCKYTAKRLLEAKPIEEERRGEHLAELLTRAGLRVEKRLFILLYRKLYNV